MSNRLIVIAADLADLQRGIEGHSLATAEKAIAAGQLLAEAKALAGHGNWTGFLEAACIPIRTAQRYMRLAASPLNATAVSHLGGIIPALDFLAQWQMPAVGKAISVNVRRGGDDIDFAYVWRDATYSDHVRIAAVVADQAIETKRPMLPSLVEDGQRPVDTVIYWLEMHGLGPINEWEVDTVDLRLARVVLWGLVTATPA